MSSKVRKCMSLATAIVLYYIVHEGAHAVFAMIYGVFKEVKPVGLGFQVVITEPLLLTKVQFALFNMAGAAATLTAAYVLVSLTKLICRNANKMVKAICYYTTLVFLINDPIYLSVLCGFFGGGDMNGIIMFGISEWAARSVFLLIAVLNVYMFAKHVYPLYMKSFQAY